MAASTPPVPAPMYPVPGAAVAVASSETASSAVAAQAKATVEARFLVALHRPRSWDQVRVQLLAACKRPGFAEAALYNKPVGGKQIIGPSIRFVEEALRATQNVLVETPVVFDDEEKRIVRVVVTDLEANLSYQQDVPIEKTVERRQPKSGEAVLRSRQNSRGETTYLIAATEDALLTKQMALVSKAIRTQGLRLLPSDIVEEAVDIVNATLQTRDAQDPAAAKKRIIDGFYNLGVGPRDLEDYLGHPLDQTSPAEIANLRLTYRAIHEGETTWAQVVEAKGDPKAPEPTKPAGKGADALRETLSKAKANKGPPAVPTPVKGTEADYIAELRVKRATGEAMTDEEKDELRLYEEDHPARLRSGGGR